MSEYFLKKTILTAISMVRDEKGQAPSVVYQFLVDLLAYNDNLGNSMSDTFYLTSVIAALGHSFLAVSLQESGQFTSEDSFLEEVNNNAFLEPAVAEIERYMSADRLVPSYHNAITVAGIEVSSFKTSLSQRLTNPDLTNCSGK
jgi:transcription initiation factor TFIID subunit 2